MLPPCSFTIGSKEDKRSLALKTMFPVNETTPPSIKIGSLKDEEQLTKIGMVHGFTSRESLLVIIPEKFIQEIEGFLRNQMLVFTVNKALPPFTGMSDKNNIQLAHIPANTEFFNEELEAFS